MVSVIEELVVLKEMFQLPRSYITSLNWPHFAENLNRAQSLLAEIRQEAVERDDQEVAKGAWCLETITEIHQMYLTAFASLQAGEYYEAWCTLERCEIRIHFLDRHFVDQTGLFDIEFIRRHVQRFQGLFPYKLFMSPEILYHDIRCSTCEARVLPRSRCGHEPGEIYSGVMCGRRIDAAAILAISLVEQPRQKYSVPFYRKDKDGKPVDHYDYCLVEYVIRGLASPWDEWTYEWKKAYHPHERFRDIGRNDPCPCESGRKYKQCCLREPGVLRPHCVVSFIATPPHGLPKLLFTDDIERPDHVLRDLTDSTVYTTAISRVEDWAETKK